MLHSGDYKSKEMHMIRQVILPVRHPMHLVKGLTQK